jgi:hypothetical protein
MLTQTPLAAGKKLERLGDHAFAARRCNYFPSGGCGDGSRIGQIDPSVLGRPKEINVDGVWQIAKLS